MYLFSTPACTSCKVLEKKLKEKGLTFDHVDCTDGKKKTMSLVKKCEVKSSVPVTVILDGDNIKYWQSGSSVDINEVETIMLGAR